MQSEVNKVAKMKAGVSVIERALARIAETSDQYKTLTIMVDSSVTLHH